jgi:hypothetical protein
MLVIILKVNMTRVLSELLGAREPMFRRGLSRLEAASGHTSTDIRLSAEMERVAKIKLRQLRLDPHDTTGAELYAVLQQKVEADDACLAAALRSKFGDTETHLTITKALAELPVPKSCFALKTVVGKRLLKAAPPRRTMKTLGYRSFDSMMRREPLLPIFAAAWLLEPLTWRKALLDAYRRLKPADFELRQLTVTAPASERWHAVANGVIAQKKHTIVGLKEFGAVVLLPLPKAEPPAATLTTLLLALHEINEVRAASTYMKLCQVKPDFGTCVQTVVTDEPTLGIELFNGPMPWQIIQRYYARFADRFRSDLFEPHVQQEDLSWHSVEKALAYIEPRLDFWQHTASLGILHQHQPVSLNVIDAALSFCNQLPYENRIIHYFRNNLWHELIIRYLWHHPIEQTMLRGLESQLVEEPQLLYS